MISDEFALLIYTITILIISFLDLLYEESDIISDEKLTDRNAIEEEDNSKIPFPLILPLFLEITVFAISIIIIGHFSLHFFEFFMTPLIISMIFIYIIIFSCRFFLIFIKNNLWEIISDPKKEKESVRGLIYWLIIVIIFFTVFISGTSTEALKFLFEFFFNPLNSLMVVFMSLIVIFFVNAIVTIFSAYASMNLELFIERMDCQTGISFLLLRKDLKTSSKLKSDTKSPLLKVLSFLAMLTIVFVFLICRILFDYYFSVILKSNRFIVDLDMLQDSIIRGFLLGYGEMLLFVSFLFLCWLVLRGEDIYLVVRNLKDIEAFKALENLEINLKKDKGEIEL